MRTDARLVPLLGLLFLTSCSGIVDFTVVSLDAVPVQANQILATADNPSITFRPAVKHSEAERLFQVTSAAGSITGDLRWSGETLTMTPSPPLTPGTRYVLSLTGSLHLASGKAQDVAFSRPFYSVTNEAALVLTGWRRALASAWGTAATEPRDIGADEAIQFQFNRPPDAVLFDRGLTLSPDPGHTITWSTDNTIATVTPSTSWKGLTRYSWTLATTIADANGVPLGEETRGHLQTLSDVTPPVLEEAGRTLRASGGWAALPESDADPLATSISDGKESLRLLFDSLLDENTLDGITWEPSLAVTTQSFVETVAGVPKTVLVLTPVDRWVPEQVYTVSLSQEIKDQAGNRLPATKVTVTVGYDFQRVESLTFTPSTASTTTTLTTFDSSTVVPVALQKSGSEDRLQVAITFHLAYTADQIPRVVQALSLESYFPVGSLTNPELINVSYSNKVLSMTYRGMIPDTTSASTFPGIHNLYRWQMQADPALTRTSGGSYLADPLLLYWEPLVELP